jgi:hypothetical protein
MVGVLAASPAAAEDDGINLREELPEGVTLPAQTVKDVMEWHNLEPVYFANTYEQEVNDDGTISANETVFAVNPETDQVYIWEGAGGLRDDTPEIGEYSPLYELVTIGENLQMNDFSEYDWFQNPHPFVKKHNVLSAEFSDTNPVCHEMGFDPQQKLCAPYDPVMGTRINEDEHNAAFRFTYNEELRTYLIGKVNNDGEKHFILDYYETTPEGATVAGKTARDIHVTDTGVRMMRGE